MDKQIKVAVIGYGFWGSKIVGEYHKLLEEGLISDLVVCDNDKGKLEQAVKTYKDIKTVSDYKDVVKYDVNCAHILAPNDMHYPITKEFFANGINCLTEKPLTQHYSESLDLVRLAKEKKLVFKTGYIWRFTNVLPAVKERLSKKFLDEIYFIRFSWHSYTDHMLNTSIVWDQFPHLLNIYSYLFDEVKHKCRITSFDAGGYRQKHSELAHIVLNYNNTKEKIIFDLSWLYPRKERAIEIYGAKNGESKLLLIDMLKQSIQHNEGEKLVMDFEKPNNTLYEEVSDYVKTVKYGLENKHNDAKSALPQLKLVERLAEYDKKKRSQA